MARPAVARIWQGRTRASLAEEYAAYLHEHGVKKLRATPGNLGVQVLRRTRDGIAEDIEKTRHLPKDAEYLLELPPHVKHYDILIGE